MRQRDLFDLGSEALVHLERLAHAALHFGIESFVEMFADDAEGQRLDRLLDRLPASGGGSIHAGAVARIVAGDGIEEQSGAGHVSAEWADLIEGTGEGDESKARHPAVSGFHADDAA